MLVKWKKKIWHLHFAFTTSSGISTWSPLSAWGAATLLEHNGGQLVSAVPWQVNHIHTHTNISKKQIQKHVTICHVYKTSNSLSRQDWNHPIWQINAVDPSLVDVRNNYIQYQHEQIHALQNVCCLEKKWAATTSLPTVEFRANPQKLSFATRRVAPQSKTSVSIYLHHGWTSGAIFGPWAITG